MQKDKRTMNLICCLFTFCSLTVTTYVKAQKTTRPVKAHSSKSFQSSTFVGGKKRWAYRDSVLSAKTLRGDSLSRLTAVLIVGHVEESTPGFIEEMRTIATYLRSVGVKVREFYDPNARWPEIMAASEGAHLFIYAGHGTNRGYAGKSGGLCLSDYAIISSDSISHSLKLHKNALVIFNHVCEGAGSSAADDGDIGIKVALGRVSDYAAPFVKLGASYYVNNFTDAIVPFIKEFFARSSVKDAYATTLPSFCTIETVQKYPYDQGLEMSVASSEPSGFSTRITVVNGVKKTEKYKDFKSYDVAFVARPDFSVIDFFR
jgi:hypothetical protein